MTVKTKLLLAQAPLAIVLILVGVLSNAVTGRLGTESRPSWPTTIAACSRRSA